MVMSMAFYL